MAGSRDLDDNSDCWMNSDAQGVHSSCYLAMQQPAKRRSPTQLTTFDVERLARTVESEIIPRLLLAHSNGRASITTASTSHETPTEAEIEAFTRLLLRRDANEGFAYTQQLSNSGVHTEDLMLGLLAPAARLLGEFWKEDICDFTEVTFALSRLQQILRELNPLIDADRHERDVHSLLSLQLPRRRVFLVAAPGEQHSFGLSVVEEFFRREDWDVWGGVALSRKKIVEVVQGNDFHIIGFSLSCEHFLDDLTSTIRAIRKASRNPGISVMVGGPFFIDHPELVAKIGADATAVDGQQAIENAQKLTQKLERQDLPLPGRS